MSIMKTIKFPGDTEPREIYDEKARNLIGNLSNLNTSNKENIVSAINEVASHSGGVNTDEVNAIISAYMESNPPIMEETDPTVPAWAKAASKPTYTASEVGALPADTVIPVVPTNVSAFTNDAGYLTSIPGEYVTESELDAKKYLTEHQDISGKLDANKLPEAIDTALAQAKTNGEFDGEDGFSPTVAINKSGKTTTVSITDKDGAKTATINDGADGTSVTIKSISESTAYDGNNVITFSDNKTVTIKNGSKGEHGESAHEIALRNGFVGDEKAWLASLCAANPTVLNKNQFSSEKEAIAYMDAQDDHSAVYVWNNKLFCHTSMEVEAICGVNIYRYRNSASSGIVGAEYATLFIFPVSSFTTPITFDFTGYKLSQSPHIYGGTVNNVFSTTLIGDGSAIAYIGATGPITLTDLKGCTYIAFAVDIANTTKGQDITITVNGTPIVLKGISSPSEIDSGMSSGATTVNGFADSGVEYAAIIGQDNSNTYLDSRNTYIMPVPSGYCETHVPGKTIGSDWLSLYDFATMSSMFSALATTHPDYVTETVLGKDASDTYDIKQYVLDAPSTLSSGYTSAMKHEKPVFILTSGLHGDEQDAVHMVYHFMKDLCENHMESDQLEYLRNNIRFVIVPICNPWGYVNKAHYNANSVDLNKNFESGYQNNGTANTGTSAHSEAETKLLKSVFDTYKNAVFHLECHGKMSQVDTFNQTIWFSLMQTLSSELVELCADTITKQIGRRLYKMGYDTNKSVGGYITYYGLNGRPKDYTGTKYGILSATIEGCGRLYGETGYSANTQKINCEALENFVLRVMDTLDSSVKK